MQVSSALKYLNEIKPPIIHYDLKPGNWHWKCYAIPVRNLSKIGWFLGSTKTLDKVDKASKSVLVER